MIIKFKVQTFMSNIHKISAQINIHHITLLLIASQLCCADLNLNSNEQAPTEIKGNGK